MSDAHQFNLHEWPVPPLLVPLFLALLIAAPVVIQR